MLCSINTEAIGHDGFNSAIKNLPIQYYVYLCILIYTIFNFQYFPTNWKKSVKIPNKKHEEDPSRARRYRPVTLLPVHRKLIGHIFLTSLQNFLHNISEQSGFRSKHSTGNELLRVYQHLCFTNIFSTLHPARSMQECCKARNFIPGYLWLIFLIVPILHIRY